VNVDLQQFLTRSTTSGAAGVRLRAGATAVHRGRLRSRRCRAGRSRPLDGGRRHRRFDRDRGRVCRQRERRRFADKPHRPLSNGPHRRVSNSLTRRDRRPRALGDHTVDHGPPGRKRASGRLQPIGRERDERRLLTNSHGALPTGLLAVVARADRQGTAGTQALLALITG
jgi:hypothetical protein